jgi:hypothetical protein
MVKLSALTLEDLLFYLLAIEKSPDDLFLSPAPQTGSKVESAHSEYSEHQNTNPSGWLIRHGDWVFMNYGPNFSPSNVSV